MESLEPLSNGQSLWGGGPLFRMSFVERLSVFSTGMEDCRNAERV